MKNFVIRLTDGQRVKFVGDGPDELTYHINQANVYGKDSGGAALARVARWKTNTAFASWQIELLPVLLTLV